MKLVVKVAYLLLLFAMAVATIHEKVQGSEATVTLFYSSHWFVFLWAALAVGGVGYMLRQRLYARPVVFGIHVGLLFVLAGALVTHLFGVQGDMSLRIGESVVSFDADGRSVSLPFAVSLTSFSVENYPGTSSPMDYVSHVVFKGQSVEQEAVISMNNICDHLGYRFCQSGYDADGQGSHLRVAHDPWGIGLTYFGYAVLFVSLVLMLVLPSQSFRRLLRQLSCVILLVILPSCGTSDVPAPKALPQDVAEQFAELCVSYNGRVCPLHTLAKDFTVKLYGRDSFRGLTPEQVLTGWYFFPTSWGRQPIIKVKGDVASELGIASRYASYSDFFGNSGYRIKSHLGVQLQRSFEEANEKINIIFGLVGGQSLQIFPVVSSDGRTSWCAQDAHLPTDLPDAERLFIQKSLGMLAEMASMGEYDQMRSFLTKLKAYQFRNAPDAMPSHASMSAELLYNRSNVTRPLAMALATLGIISFVVYVLVWTRGQSVPRTLDRSLCLILAVALAYMTMLVALRGYVSGHVPLVNGYETMQFMAICVMALALAMRHRFVLVVPFGLLLSGLSLLVSMMGESNPQITPLMPVLASPLLSIHVCVIMFAYSLVAFTMLCGVASFFTRDARHVAHLADVSRLLLYPAVAFLAIGIFVGAIWANQSWGRYWGWDPKEVWALITLMIYVFPLHPSLVPQLARPRAFHLFTVISFLSVLMTYFGVNFILGGLHSYANS